MTLDDQASDRELLDRELALKRRKPAGPPPCGFCHNCNDPLPPNLRFCDGNCREDWEYREQRK